MPRKTKQRRGRKYQKRRIYRNYKYGQMGNKVSRVVHNFKREVFLGQAQTSITSAGVVTNYAQGWNFRLSDLPNVSEYVSLFDQFKLTGVKFKVMPKVSSIANTSNSMTLTGFGQIITCLDFDDVTTPTNKDELLQYNNVKVSHPNRQHHRYFNPTMLSTIYRVGLADAHSVMKCKWLDMAYTDTPTYGLKMWIDGPQVNPLGGSPVTPATVTYDIYATYYFKCKATR